MSLAVGATFDGYTILRPLGAGGMAEVYLAQHPRLPRRGALKILSEAITADSAYRERFQREADLAAALWHPNVVAVHDRGEVYRTPFVATRTGDVAPTVIVADPALFAAPTAPASTPPRAGR